MELPTLVRPGRMAFLVRNALEGLDKIIDKNKKELLDFLSLNASRMAAVIPVCLVGAGFVYIAKRWYLTSKLRRFNVFSGLYRSKLKVPAVYPVYVENRRTVENLSKELSQGPGVLVLWGPPDSGKSTYTIRTCNQLLVDGKIGGLIQLNDSTFAECDSDGGVHWLNTALGHELLRKNEKMSALIPSNGPDDSLYERIMSYFFRRNKRVVILLDQFDNVCEHSDMEKLFTFIKRLAEDSVKHDSYCVLLCITELSIARRVLALNGGKKIRLLQRPQDLKWGEEELEGYFGNTSYTAWARLAGTPGFCVDIVNKKIQSEENVATNIDEAWRKGAALGQ